jgi:CheY-like chemotaxis protein
VLKADDAASALGILKSGIPIDLLFTDVVMPGELRSPELARQAKILIPGIAVLFTSGYTQNAIVHGGRLDPGVHLISKPYRREQLARKVRHLLAKGQPESAETPQTGERKAATNQPRHILAVEDNEDALSMTCELLKQLGHKVHGAATAEEALRLFDSEKFDILFTDFSLPGMNGVDLAKQLKQSQPNLRIVIASGYGNVISNDNELGAVVITKPYGLMDLEEILTMPAR